MEEGEEDVLNLLLNTARPILVRPRRRLPSLPERANAMGASDEQLEALRKACILLSTHLSADPSNCGLRAQLAALLDSLWTGSFANAALMAAALDGVAIDEEEYFACLDRHVFSSSDQRQNARFTKDVESLMENMGKSKQPRPKEGSSIGTNTSTSANEKDKDRTIFSNSGAFTTAKKVLDSNPMFQRRKNLGGKRWGVKEEAGSNADDQDAKTEFGYYNLSKAPPQPRPAPHKKQTEEKDEGAVVDERLQGIEPKLIELIRNEIMHRVDSITWERIAGLEHAKKTIFEIVIWPMLRPYHVDFSHINTANMQTNHE